MNIIEELFYGNLNPNFQDFDHNSQYKKAMNIIARNEEILTEWLDGKEKSRFLDLINAYGEVLGVISAENFINGFQMGARFIFDIFLADPERILKDNT